jgi:hypothetical protein
MLQQSIYAYEIYCSVMVLFRSGETQAVRFHVGVLLCLTFMLIFRPKERNIKNMHIHIEYQYDELGHLWFMWSFTTLVMRLCGHLPHYFWQFMWSFTTLVGETRLSSRCSGNER